MVLLVQNRKKIKYAYELGSYEIPEEQLYNWKLRNKKEEWWNILCTDRKRWFLIYKTV